MADVLAAGGEGPVARLALGVAEAEVARAAAAEAVEAEDRVLGFPVVDLFFAKTERGGRQALRVREVDTDRVVGP
ncbi:MAG TPA: hypothetical protein PL039_11475, partial [Kiritimatiellia bacterium]|nr:hypothetical protein [Kiritimatiellia bacterium]